MAGKRLGLVTLLVAGALLALPARADVRRIWLTVQGATCPKCGFGPVKSLKRLPGVMDASLTVNPQRLEVQPAPGVWLEPGRLVGVVRRSNLKPVPEDVRLMVTGTLQAWGDGAALALDDMREPRVLRLISTASGGASGPRAEIGSRVEIVGVWRPGSGRKADNDSLVVHTVRRLDDQEPTRTENER